MRYIVCDINHNIAIECDLIYPIWCINIDLLLYIILSYPI